MRLAKISAFQSGKIYLFAFINVLSASNQGSWIEMKNRLYTKKWFHLIEAMYKASLESHHYFTIKRRFFPSSSFYRVFYCCSCGIFEGIWKGVTVQSFQPVNMFNVRRISNMKIKLKSKRHKNREKERHYLKSRKSLSSHL